MISYIKTFFQVKRDIVKAKKVFESNNYYTDLNEIPLLNWWKCREGDLTYLWKERQKYVPFFFKRFFDDMAYQMDWIDLDELRRLVQANYFMNKYLVTEDIKWKRKADTKFAEYKMMSNEEKQEQKLNDLIKFVQLTLKLSFQIDPLTIKAGYFLSLYHEAIKISRDGNN